MPTFAVVKEEVVPYAGSALGKKQQVELMFDRIAFRYDLMNRLLSFGIDRMWRNKMIRMLGSVKHDHVLDVATGTADVALLAASLGPQSVTGIDLSEEMLHHGRKKIQKKKLEHLVHLQQADSEAMPFESNKFDAVTVSFGVRNFENLEQGLGEIYRVLKPGGTLLVLEFSKPRHFPIRELYRFYFTWICPLLGRWITGDRQAYSYLHRSVNLFPEGRALTDILEKTGFVHAQCTPLTFGISTLYSAGK